MTSSFNQFASQPTLLSVIRAFQEETFAKLNCMRIGIIEEVLSINEVRCSITNKQLMRTNDDGSSVWQEYPPIFARVFYLGSGGTGVAFPLTVGEPCLLLFNDREFDSYFKTGEVSPLVDDRMHSLSDAICIPLYQPTYADVFDVIADNIELSAGESITLQAETININASTININGELIVNGQPYLSHTHSNGNQGADTGGVVV